MKRPGDGRRPVGHRLDATVRRPQAQWRDTDETTIRNLRHLLEEYELAEDILVKVNKLLAARVLISEQSDLFESSFLIAFAPCTYSPGTTLQT
jgi:hypothetical protein